MSQNTIFILAVGLLLLIGTAIHRLSKPVIHEDLELRAELLARSHDVDEIKKFLDSKMNYLTRKSFQMLLDRIEQLDSDKSYADSLIKEKIDSL